MVEDYQMGMVEDDIRELRFQLSDFKDEIERLNKKVDLLKSTMEFLCITQENLIKIVRNGLLEFDNE